MTHSFIASIVRGFHDRTPLSEEANVVFTLAKARLGASVSISAWRRHQAGETDEYALISERPAWAMIQTLDEVPVRLAEGIVREAAGLSASPKTPVLVDWLKKQTFSRVMEIPGTEEKISVLDLSVSSPLLRGKDTEDTEDFTRRVFRHMEDRKASLGIGRYLEPRTLYLEDIFKGRSGDPRESRTVHTGIDIFCQAGGEVYAPLAGRIRSIVNNAQNLDYGPTVILEHRSAERSDTLRASGVIYRRKSQNGERSSSRRESPGSAHRGKRRMALALTLSDHYGPPRLRRTFPG